MTFMYQAATPGGGSDGGAAAIGCGSWWHFN
jgi:hypothetical protein